MPAPADDPDLPSSVPGEAFQSLFRSSPFTRTLGISDSIILTGIARFQNEVYATLMNTETMESHVVSSTANAQGWQLVGVGGSEADLQTLTAKIQIGGDQVISVRYQKPPPKRSKSSSGSSGSGSGGTGGSSPPLSSSQMEEAKKAAVNYKEGFSSDGFPREPPPEVVQKLSRLSVNQREDINRQMLGLRNRGMSMDERRSIYLNMVDRAAQGSR